MAMQAGMGLSRILILVGAGYTGTILLKNGKLSDVLGELQSLIKGMEKTGEHADGDAEYSDRRRPRYPVYRNPTCLCVGSSIGNGGNLSSFIVPAATLGALGYGYMWWKGLKFSDLMYVTKRNMASAVSNLTKHLEHVSEALAVSFCLADCLD
ncbi:hypothetical protein CJ030_MR7G017478 [Morella rubra]|uniref:DUF1664 domain-containing protein n=1 Tax=Morella rubra TaxID=262757 RepID=A0A6A1V3P6_9ROSI|nr:hypothetical protein CJ030_MR7G017478 [Morella rubra]